MEKAKKKTHITRNRLVNLLFSIFFHLFRLAVNQDELNAHFSYKLATLQYKTIIGIDPGYKLMFGAVSHNQLTRKYSNFL